MAEGTPCPNCGSKRTTEIAASDRRPGSIWCHACGAVSAVVDDTDHGAVVAEAERVLTAQRG
jgi:hypothetical protein